MPHSANDFTTANSFSAPHDVEKQENPSFSREQNPIVCKEEGKRKGKKALTSLPCHFWCSVVCKEGVTNETDLKPYHDDNQFFLCFFDMFFPNIVSGGIFTVMCV